MFLDLGLGECPDRELLTITNEVRFRSTRLGRIWWQFGKNKRVVAASTESEEDRRRRRRRFVDRLGAISRRRRPRPTSAAAV